MRHLVKSFAKVKIYYVYSIPSTREVTQSKNEINLVWQDLFLENLCWILAIIALLSKCLHNDRLIICSRIFPGIDVRLTGL